MEGNQNTLEEWKVEIQAQAVLQKHKGLTKRKLAKRIIFIVLGAIIASAGLELFLVPNDVIDGGIVGVSIILAHLTHMPIGVFLLLLNMPFFLIGYKQIGKTFALSTIFGIVVLSVATYFLHPVEVWTKDPFLAAVFGGIAVGVGVGLVVRYGGSLDGTEIIGILVSKTSPFTVGEIIMFINIFILASAGPVFGWDHAMYSLVAYFIAYKTIDITIEGMDESRSVWVISDKYREIGDAIVCRLGRGVTYLNGEGGFTGDDKMVVFCVITRLEEAKLKAIVDDFDDMAFLAIGRIHDVKGGRFKKKDIH